MAGGSVNMEKEKFVVKDELDRIDNGNVIKLKKPPEFLVAKGSQPDYKKGKK